MKIGFIGLGIMGSRMAANLQKKGFDLIVFNRTKSRAEDLIAKGAGWADTPMDLAKQVDLLFTMLSTPEIVRGLAVGPRGFLGALRPNALWVDCSTVHPSFAREMTQLCRDKGLRRMDAPVSGSKMPAELGKLLFLVGGDSADLEECRPFFDAMGQKTFYMGGHGMGASMKMVVNLLMGESMLAFAEALVLGESLGIGRPTLLDALLATPIAAPFMLVKRPKIEEGTFEPDFPLKWMQKDFHLVSVTAYEQGVALPAANLGKEIYRMAMQNGLADKDMAAVYKFLNRKEK